MKIDDKYKWIARDENGTLYVYKNKPFKRKGFDGWECSDIFEPINKTEFPLVKWEDEEPTEL